MRLLLTFFLLLLSSNILTQELDSELLKNLNEEQKQALALELSSNNNQENEVQKKDESLVDANNEKVEVENKKFGYDFFSKIPTTITPTQDLPVPNDYKISLQDEINVLLTGTKNRNFSLKVNLDGSILFPEIGSVYVVGQSVKEVEIN